ncbi:hypothetical protein PG988_011745 [Apiospora saccharicola]
MAEISRSFYFDIIVGCLLAFLVAKCVRFVQKRRGNQKRRGGQQRHGGQQCYENQQRRGNQARRGSDHEEFLHLPNEIVLEIFSYLPQSAFDQLRLVNRAANALVGPPRRMVLNSPGQSALLRSVTSALNASPESFSKLRYAIFLSPHPYGTRALVKLRRPRPTRDNLTLSDIRKLEIVANDDLDQAKAGGYWLLGPPSTMARLVCDDNLVPAIGMLMVSDF